MPVEQKRLWLALAAAVEVTLVQGWEAMAVSRRWLSVRLSQLVAARADLDHWMVPWG